MPSIRISVLSAFFVLLLPLTSGSSQNRGDYSQSFDLLLVHGALIDGSGGQAQPADLGIRGDRIAFVGDASKTAIQAIRTIDVSGLIVAPGFIDPHTHAFDDLSDTARKSNEPYLMQGVTTVVTGNDGSGPLPIAPALKKWDEQGIGTNALLLVGMCSVRS